MNHACQTITLCMPFGMGSVNCYLIEGVSSQEGRAGFVLIDTGASNRRRALLRELEKAGCRPGQLKLILLTHGDFDHCGSAAHLRGAWGAPIAMHADDAAMPERGDMFANRKQPGWLIRSLLPLFTGFGRRERFTPDVLLADGADLSAYGLAARVLSIPGHSKGSIAVHVLAGGLTEAGDLFCGDLLENSGRQPALNALMDDPAAGRASLQKLVEAAPGMVYPGHGGPFRMEQVG